MLLGRHPELSLAPFAQTSEFLRTVHIAVEASNAWYEPDERHPHEGGARQDFRVLRVQLGVVHGQLSRVENFHLRP